MRIPSPATIAGTARRVAQRPPGPPQTDSAVDGALSQEAHFWGTVTQLLLDSGAVPYDVDRQGATPIRDRDILLKLGSRRADPQIEEHWRGTFVDQTLAVLQGMGAQRVLELGCGAGWLSLEMARKGLTVDAVDLSEERIGIARRYYRERCRKEQLADVRYDVENLEIYSPNRGVYDAIVTFTTLHHVQNKQELVERCYGALPGGGKLIVFDDEHDAGPWVSRGFTGAVVFALALLLLPAPSAVPHRRRFLEAAHRLAEGVLTTGALRRVRSVAAPILWRGEDSGVIAGGSPFEGVENGHHHSIHDLLAEVFEQVHVTRAESFGFRNLLVLDLPRSARATLTAVLHRLDQKFANSAWLPGTSIYAVATKRP